MSSLREVSLLEIIQARSKDRVYAKELEEHSLNILQSLGSPSFVSRDLALIHRWTSLLYRLLTSFGHPSSLGQEICGIAPVEAGRQQPVSFIKLFLSEVTQSFGDTWLSALARLFFTTCHRNVLSTFVIEALRWLADGFSIARRSVFDIQGIVCLELLHWILRIRHIRVGTKKGGRASRLTSLVFLLILLLRINRQLRTSSLYTMLREAPTNRQEKGGEAGPDCAMCKGPRTDPTLAPCGHVFCWECAAHWFSTHAECPHCRTKGNAAGLILLRNYR
ncbi:hypothetical protein RvY_15033 [Ramazzottius varieornatus]|uniref:RING-type E3 ubiquitin transferase n=1 Tax=Ramazzottius varieornatus TaxID=947166 RepID=A0A1D1VUV3_RAMVA|nr:hypothetical protein RvY_15033 [Ramazzottius varieornatus]